MVDDARGADQKVQGKDPVLIGRSRTKQPQLAPAVTSIIHLPGTHSARVGVARVVENTIWSALPRR
jgi:hypothetical protein